MEIALIAILLPIFQLKHFLADYPLQTDYMLGKFKTGTEWILPLTAHALIHAFFTLIIVWLFANNDWVIAIKLAIMDFAIHFVIDKGKVLANRVFGNDIQKPVFWWILGADQALHHLTHYYIICRIFLYHIK